MKSLLFASFFVALFAILGVSEVPGQYVWTKSPSPVLTPSALGTWYKQVWSPSILYNPDSSRFEMWFSAGPGPELNWEPFQIAFATSKDGLSWDVVGTGPVLTAIPGTWEANVCNPSVLREGGSYRMWYTAFRGYRTSDSAYIAYATSPDGITWTRYANNPLLRPGPAAWEYNGIGDVYVIHRNTFYEMWYDGGPLYNVNIGRIGRATSVDGIYWTKDTVNNPVLDMGGAGQWDQGGIWFPRLFSISDTMFMCYTCVKSDGDWRRIGLARSSDGGTTWEKYGMGPILSPGPGGSWDQQFVQEGYVLEIRDTLHMWYLGMSYNPVGASIGHATSPLIVTGVADRDAALPEGFALAQNYPNPFNPSTRIGYSIPASREYGVGSRETKLVVYDILGREVAVLVNEKKAPGSYEVEFDARDIANGMYLYRLQSGNYVETKKMLILK